MKCNQPVMEPHFEEPLLNRSNMASSSPSGKSHPYDSRQHDLHPLPLWKSPLNRKVNFTFFRFFPYRTTSSACLRALIVKSCDTIWSEQQKSRILFFLFHPSDPHNSSANSSAKAESICHVGRHASVKEGRILVDHSQTPPQVLCKEHSQHVCEAKLDHIWNILQLTTHPKG